MRVTWLPTNQESTDQEAASFTELIVAIVRGPVGMSPMINPVSNGIQDDGSLKFTDWRGCPRVARAGDEIEMTTAGWVLHPKR